MVDLLTEQGRAHLITNYRTALLSDVIPFWLQHGLDAQHGGYFTALEHQPQRQYVERSLPFAEVLFRVYQERLTTQNDLKVS